MVLRKLQLMVYYRTGLNRIDFSVPQGSCLGPLLFVIYSSKLFNIVNKHLPNVHAYADDTQLQYFWPLNLVIKQRNCCCVIYMYTILHLRRTELDSDG